MLSLSGVDSFYGRSHILHDLSFQVSERQVTVILGRNGTGKTTLLRSIMGLTDRTSGRISFCGTAIDSQVTFRRARAGIAYVPQGREIFPQFTIRENILMGTYARIDGIRAIPDAVGELFPYLVANLDRPGGLLSGGQQQQLAIARALAASPKLLLLDEPTEGIQPNIVEEIEDLIISLNRNAGMTILLVEQNVAFAKRAGQAFGMMEKGRIVASGCIEELTDEVVHAHMAV